MRCPRGAFPPIETGIAVDSCSLRLVFLSGGPKAKPPATRSEENCESAAQTKPGLAEAATVEEAGGTRSPHVTLRPGGTQRSDDLVLEATAATLDHSHSAGSARRMLGSCVLPSGLSFSGTRGGRERSRTQRDVSAAGWRLACSASLAPAAPGKPSTTSGRSAPFVSAIAGSGTKTTVQGENTTSSQDTLQDASAIKSSSSINQDVKTPSLCADSLKCNIDAAVIVKVTAAQVSPQHGGCASLSIKAESGFTSYDLTFPIAGITGTLQGLQYNLATPFTVSVPVHQFNSILTFVSGPIRTPAGNTSFAFNNTGVAASSSSASAPGPCADRHRLAELADANDVNVNVNVNVHNNNINRNIAAAGARPDKRPAAPRPAGLPLARPSAHHIVGSVIPAAKKTSRNARAAQHRRLALGAAPAIRLPRGGNGGPGRQGKWQKVGGRPAAPRPHLAEEAPLPPATVAAEVRRILARQHAPRRHANAGKGKRVKPPKPASKFDRRCGRQRKARRPRRPAASTGRACRAESNRRPAPASAHPGSGKSPVMRPAGPTGLVGAGKRDQKPQITEAVFRRLLVGLSIEQDSPARGSRPPRGDTGDGRGHRPHGQNPASNRGGGGSTPGGPGGRGGQQGRGPGSGDGRGGSDGRGRAPDGRGAGAVGDTIHAAAPLQASPRGNVIWARRPASAEMSS